MTTHQVGDLLLGHTLAHMCDRNDHEIVLHCMQLLGRARRSGYLTTDELIRCLIYCGNRFADNRNGDFFMEYVQYMPDINNVDDLERRFTPLCKSYYFAYKHAEGILDRLQTICMSIDTIDLLDWFRSYLINKGVTTKWQLDNLLSKARASSEALTNDKFKDMAEQYTVPIQMKTGP